MNIHNFKTVSAAFILCIVFSCEIQQWKEYSLIFPDLPANWEQLCGDTPWKITFLSAEGSVEIIEAASNEKEVTVLFPVFPYMLCTAEKDGNFLPAGICEKADKRVYLFSWEAGPAAQLLLGLPEPHRIMYQIDIESLSLAFCEKSDQSPWDIDTVRLKRLLLNGTLNGNQYKKYPEYILPFSIEGIITSADPFFKNEGGSVFLKCRPGINVFYTSASIILINADQYGWKMTRQVQDEITDVLYGSW